MENICNSHGNKQNMIKLSCFLSSDLHIQGFRTCNFDKYRYELLQCHIKQLHWILHTRFSDLLHWTVVNSTMLKIVFCAQVHILCFVNEPTI